MKENTNYLEIFSSSKIVQTLGVAVGGIISLVTCGLIALGIISSNQSINIAPLFQAESAIISFAGSDVDLNVKVANDPSELSQGLMNVTGLPENEGMLFVFNNEAIRSFWMKNTLISLDIIFLNKDFEVVTIQENTIVNQTEILYKSTEPAQLVLEVNAGWAERNQIKVGSKLEVKALF